MSRIDPVDWEGDPTFAAQARRVLAERDRIGSLYPVLMHSPPIVEGVLAMGTAVRQRAGLDPRVRELVICLVGELNGAAYEVRRHREVAASIGVDPDRLDHLLDRAAAFGPDELAALDLAAEMTRSVGVTDETFDRVAAAFTPAEVVELVATVGYYNMISRVLVALRIGEDVGLTREK